MDQHCYGGYFFWPCKCRYTRHELLHEFKIAVNGVCPNPQCMHLVAVHPASVQSTNDSMFIETLNEIKETLIEEQKETRKQQEKNTKILIEEFKSERISATNANQRDKLRANLINVDKFSKSNTIRCSLSGLPNSGTNPIEACHIIDMIYYRNDEKQEWSEFLADEDINTAKNGVFLHKIIHRAFDNGYITFRKENGEYKCHHLVEQYKFLDGFTLNFPNRTPDKLPNENLFALKLEYIKSFKNKYFQTCSFCNKKRYDMELHHKESCAEKPSDYNEKFLSFIQEVLDNNNSPKKKNRKLKKYVFFHSKR